MIKFDEDFLIPVDKRIIHTIKEAYKKYRSALTAKEVCQKLNITHDIFSRTARELIKIGILVVFRQRKSVYYTIKDR